MSMPIFLIESGKVSHPLRGNINRCLMRTQEHPQTRKNNLHYLNKILKTVASLFWSQTMSMPIFLIESGRVSHPLQENINRCLMRTQEHPQTRKNNLHYLNKILKTVASLFWSQTMSMPIFLIESGRVSHPLQENINRCLMRTQEHPQTRKNNLHYLNKILKTVASLFWSQTMSMPIFLIESGRVSHPLQENINRCLMRTQEHPQTRKNNLHYLNKVLKTVASLFWSQTMSMPIFLIESGRVSHPLQENINRCLMRTQEHPQTRKNNLHYLNKILKTVASLFWSQTMSMPIFLIESGRVSHPLQGNINRCQMWTQEHPQTRENNLHYLNKILKTVASLFWSQTMSMPIFLIESGKVSHPLRGNINRCLMRTQEHPQTRKNNLHYLNKILKTVASLFWSQTMSMPIFLIESGKVSHPLRGNINRCQMWTQEHPQTRENNLHYLNKILKTVASLFWSQTMSMLIFLIESGRVSHPLQENINRCQMWTQEHPQTRENNLHYLNKVLKTVASLFWSQTMSMPIFLIESGKVSHPLRGNINRCLMRTQEHPQTRKNNLHYLNKILKTVASLFWSQTMSMPIFLIESGKVSHPLQGNINRCQMWTQEHPQTRENNLHYLNKILKTVASLFWSQTMSMPIFLIESGKVSHPLRGNINRCQMWTQEHPQTRENNLHYLNKILKTVASLFWSQTMSMPIFLIESGKVSHPLRGNINRCQMWTQEHPQTRENNLHYLNKILKTVASLFWSQTMSMLIFLIESGRVSHPLQENINRCQMRTQEHPQTRKNNLHYLNKILKTVASLFWSQTMSMPIFLIESGKVSHPLRGNINRCQMWTQEHPQTRENNLHYLNKILKTVASLFWSQTMSMPIFLIESGRVSHPLQENINRCLMRTQEHPQTRKNNLHYLNKILKTVASLFWSQTMSMPIFLIESGRVSHPLQENINRCLMRTQEHPQTRENNLHYLNKILKTVASLFWSQTMSMPIFLIESGKVSHPLRGNINRCQMWTQEHPQTRENNLHYLNKILKTVASLFWSQTMSMPIFLIESGRVSHPLQENINRCLMRTQEHPQTRKNNLHYLNNVLKTVASLFWSQTMSMPIFLIESGRVSHPLQENINRCLMRTQEHPQTRKNNLHYLNKILKTVASLFWSQTMSMPIFLIESGRVSHPLQENINRCLMRTQEHPQTRKNNLHYLNKVLKTVASLFWSQTMSMPIFLIESGRVSHPLQENINRCLMRTQEHPQTRKNNLHYLNKILKTVASLFWSQTMSMPIFLIESGRVSHPLQGNINRCQMWTQEHPQTRENNLHYLNKILKTVASLFWSQTMSMPIFLIESGKVSHPLRGNINRCLMRTQEHPQTRKNNLHYLNKILKTVASLFWSQTMSMPIFLIESGRVSHPLQENINRCLMRTQEHPQTRKNNLHYLNKILKTVASLFWSQTMSMPIFLIESGRVSHPLQENINRCLMRTQEHPQTRKNNLHYLNKVLKTVASLFWSQTMSMPIFLIESGRVSHPLQENINRCLMRTQEHPQTRKNNLHYLNKILKTVASLFWSQTMSMPIFLIESGRVSHPLQGNINRCQMWTQEHPQTRENNLHYLNKILKTVASLFWSQTMSMPIFLIESGKVSHPLRGNINRCLMRTQEHPQTRKNNLHYLNKILKTVASLFWSQTMSMPIFLIESGRVSHPLQGNINRCQMWTQEHPQTRENNLHYLNKILKTVASLFWSQTMSMPIFLIESGRVSHPLQENINRCLMRTQEHPQTRKNNLHYLNKVLKTVASLFWSQTMSMPIFLIESGRVSHPLQENINRCLMRTQEHPQTRKNNLHYLNKILKTVASLFWSQTMSMPIFLIESGRVSHPLQGNINRCQMWTQEHPQTRENNLHYLNKILKTVASLFWSQTMSMPIFLIESGKVSHPLRGNINRCLMRTQEHPQTRKNNLHYLNKILKTVASLFWSQTMSMPIFLIESGRVSHPLQENINRCLMRTQEHPQTRKNNLHYLNKILKTVASLFWSQTMSMPIFLIESGRVSHPLQENINRCLMWTQEHPQTRENNLHYLNNVLKTVASLFGLKQCQCQFS